MDAIPGHGYAVPSAQALRICNFGDESDVVPMNLSDDRGSPEPVAMLDRWVRAIAEVTDLLAVARGLAEVAPDVFRVMARLGDFDRGALWVKAPGAAEWTRSRAWVRDADAPVELADGVGNGHVHELVERAASLRRPLTSAGGETLVLPTVHGDTCFGVLEMARRDPFALAGPGAAAAASIGRQIGQFAAREATFRELVRSRRELSDLFENAPVGIHLMDQEGRILRVNRAEMEKLGYSREELVGRLWREFHEDPAVADRLLARLTAAGASDSDAGETGGEAVRIRRRDGQFLWALVVANVLRDPAPGEHGSIVHIRTFVRDVTATIDATVALRASEERYRRLVEGAREYALHGLDVEGRVTSWNVGAERLFGYAEADVLHRDFTLSMDPDDRRDDVAARILRLAADEGEFRHEGWRVRKGGARFWAEVVYSAIRDDAGRLVGISQLSRDVSERRGLDALRRKSADLEAANREVIDSSRRRAELLRSVAAAIEGPAGEIEVAASGIRAEARMPSDTAAFARLDEAVTRLLDAVEGLQHLASGAASEQAPGPKPIDLARVTHEARDMLGELAAARRIRVDIDVDPAIDDVVTHADRLRQVVYNLLSNAIRSSRDRGRVVLRITGEGKANYRIEVQDSGPGLSPASMADAFSAGSQGAGETDASSGIGLEVSRRIVEEQGGRVSVQSALGHGSVFAAVLPRRPVDAPTSGRDASSRVGPVPRVLVVAEDASTRAGLSWALGHSGFEFALANRLEEGVRAITDDRFDAVAVDLLLPRGGALEFVTSLRRAGASRDATWILATLGTAAAGVGCCAVSDVLPVPTPADRMFATLERRRVPRGRGTTIIVGDADPLSREAALRTLRLLGYDARGESEGEACLRACAECSPPAIILSPWLEGMGVFTFARHVRALPGLERVPLFLALPREIDAERWEALKRDALAAVGDRSWERCLRPAHVV